MHAESRQAWVPELDSRNFWLRSKRPFRDVRLDVGFPVGLLFHALVL